MSKGTYLLASSGKTGAVVLLALAALNVAFGVATDVKHPWYDGRLEDAELKKAKAFVKPLMDLSDEQIIELIPARKPFQGRVSMLEDRASWSPLRPKHLTAGKETFIPEERWPITDKQTVTGPDGKVLTYEYMNDRRGEPFYPGCLRDDVARGWFVDAALHLARIYNTTNDKTCAQKAAVIIARFAQIYPTYPVTGSSSSAGPKKFYAKEPYPPITGKWARAPVSYASDGPYFQSLVLAYDLICPSGEIEELARVWKRNLRQEIEEKWFLDHCNLMMKYDQWYADKPALTMDNLQPYKCRTMIAIGRTIGNPGLVHYAYEYLRRLVNATFMVDGVFPESPDYHRQVVGSIGIGIDFLKGYSDPQGYTYARTGHRFDNYNAENDMPVLVWGKQFLKDASYPDGRLMTVHDTWSTTHGGAARTQTTSRIWPAFGHAILGRGNDESQMEAHLHFSNGYGHSHQDTLNLSIWALGEELLSDVGYSHTKYRKWATSSLSHNLVVVDGTSQQGGIQQTTAWVPMQKGFGVVEAQAAKCYAACSTYSRTVMMVEHSPSQAFCVDVFTVAGGSQHDWIAHGSADKDQTLQFDKPDKPFADSLAADGKIHIPGADGEETTEDSRRRCDVTDAVSPFWGNIRHVKKVDGPGPWLATFAGKQETDASLRLHLLTPKDCQLYAGEVPSIRRAQEKESQVEKYMMPILTARREPKGAGIAPMRSKTKAASPGGSQQLTSRYVTVWEPFRRQPWIEKADVLYDALNGVALSVQVGGVKYLILWSPEGSKGFVLPGGTTFSGRFGCLRQEGQQQNLSVVGPGAYYGYANAPRMTPIRPLTLVDIANEKGQDYMVFQSGPIQLPDPAWGILWHPDGYRRAVRLGRRFSQPGTLKIECPDGLGLIRARGKQTWQETCFPERSFQGPMTLEIIQRMDLPTPPPK